MKVYISVDIEGTANAVGWDSTAPGGLDYERNRLEMTKEAVAAARGAHAAGADEIVIKDAHGHGNNILPEYMPEYVELIRSYTYAPDVMVEGIDESFDAAFYVGYHSAAGCEGNNLAHTISHSKVHSIKVNGEIASEFMIYSYMAAYRNVPSVLLTGDRSMCQTGKKYHPCLVTVPVKDDIGGRNRGISGELACKQIEKAAKHALEQDLAKARIVLPGHFDVELCFKDHTLAKSGSYYPGATQKDPYTITFQSDDWYNVGRFLIFTIL